jgi:F420-dependent oxidoreductase-like protein
MRLGYSLGYWSAGPPPGALETVIAAERLGFDSVWTSEAYGSDAFTPLAWWGSRTERVRLGTAIAQISARTPTATAMAALTLDHLSGGRFVLGLGASGPQVVEGLHGQPFGPQIQRTREYVTVVRQALARERIELHGETLDLPRSDGAWRSMKLTISPVQDPLPIYIAAIGPNNTRLAGEVADGWIPILFAPDHMGDFRPLLEEGAAAGGRSLDGFEIAPTVSSFVSDDREFARNLMRPVLALYIGGMGSRKQNFYNNLVQRYGFEDAAREVQDLYLDGKKAEAGEAIPAELIDMVSLCGPRDVVRDRLAAFRDAGVGTLMITPMAFTADDRIAQLRAIAEIAG